MVTEEKEKKRKEEEKFLIELRISKFLAKQINKINKRNECKTHKLFCEIGIYVFLLKNINFSLLMITVDNQVTNHNLGLNIEMLTLVIYNISS